MRRRLSALLLLCALLSAGLAPAGAEAPAPLSGAVYQVFVPSFYDADGDGVGDLRGISEKIPYIQALGARGLWLTPVSPSPSYHGYDVTDYTGINPRLGTLADYRELAARCDGAGIRLLFDLVLNHSSSEHPWFRSALQSLTREPCGQAACAAPDLCRAHNPYVNYYLFSQNGQGHPAPGAPGWSYYGHFGPHMPDFNLDDPGLRADIADIARFWLSQGADGFRLDAVIHFYEENNAKNAAFLAWFAGVVREERPDAFLVAEAWKDANTILALYRTGLDALFNFPFSGADGAIAKALREADGAGLARKAAEWQNRVAAARPGAADAPFLSNHDTGRSAGFLRMDPRRMKLAAAVYLLLPGVPFVYYGEELGMTGSGRDENKRLPMLWSLADPEGSCLPPEGADQAQRLKAAADTQEGDPDSLLGFYRGVLALRNRAPALARGHAQALDLGASGVLAIRAGEEAGANLVLANLGAEPVTLPAFPGAVFLGGWDTGFGAPAPEGDTLVLPPYSGCVFQE